VRVTTGNRHRKGEQGILDSGAASIRMGKQRASPTYKVMEGGWLWSLIGSHVSGALGVRGKGGTKMIGRHFTDFFLKGKEGRGGTEKVEHQRGCYQKDHLHPKGASGKKKSY